jgi:hypothetical protein
MGVIVAAVALAKSPNARRTFFAVMIDLLTSLLPSSWETPPWEMLVGYPYLVMLRQIRQSSILLSGTGARGMPWEQGARIGRPAGENRYYGWKIVERFLAGNKLNKNLNWPSLINPVPVSRHGEFPRNGIGCTVERPATESDLRSGGAGYFGCVVAAHYGRRIFRRLIGELEPFSRHFAMNHAWRLIRYFHYDLQAMPRIIRVFHCFVGFGYRHNAPSPTSDGFAHCLTVAG